MMIDDHLFITFIYMIYFRGMLSSAHVLAMDAKNLLDVVDKIRIKYPQVNQHILRGGLVTCKSSGQNSSASSSLSSSAASSLEKNNPSSLSSLSTSSSSSSSNSCNPNLQRRQY